MKSRFCIGLFLACFLLSSHARDRVGLAAPIELEEFEELGGILAWSFRLPEDVGPDEYARLEWRIFPGNKESRVEPSGISFPDLRSNGEIKLFLWIDDLSSRDNPEIQSIPYCIKTRGGDGVWRKEKGDLPLPEGFTELFGFEKSGPSDLNWFLMLIRPENDQESALLNLGYTPTTKN